MKTMPEVVKWFRSILSFTIMKMLLNDLATENLKIKPSRQPLKMNQGLPDISTLGLTILSYLPHCGLTSQLIIPWWQGGDHPLKDCCTTDASKVKLNSWTSRYVWCSAEIDLRTVANGRNNKTLECIFQSPFKLFIYVCKSTGIWHCFFNLSLMK